MPREITDPLSMGLDIYNCIILTIMIIALFQAAKTSKKSFDFMMACFAILIFNITDMATWFSEGTSPAWHIPYLRISTFLFYLDTPFIFTFLMKYVQDYLNPKKLHPFFFRATCIISFFYILCTILTPFTGLYYYYTPDNHYVRGDYNFISVIFYMIYYAISVICIIIYRKYFKRNTFLSFISYSVVPMLCHLVQIRFYGLSLVNTGMTLSILLVYINSHKDLEFSFAKSEIDNQHIAKKIIQFQEHTIISLSNLCENRDTETGEHARRTSMFVELLAQQTKDDGYYPEILTDRYIKHMVKAAPMHDIGKIVVSDTVLKKPGKLNSNEYESMKQHTNEGGRIVNQIIGFSDDKDYVNIAIDMAQSHHERWDGTGYPKKLKGHDIPLSARFMAVADVFDALIFERCYKEPIPSEEAFEIIAAESGTHFDPILVKEFLKIKESILRVISE